LMFDVDVSADTGAYWNSAASAIVWDANSKGWQNATWETGKMEFGYDLYTGRDPITGEDFSRVENIFIDQREFNAPPRVKQNIC
jgi:hypothetical protein